MPAPCGDCLADVTIRTLPCGGLGITIHHDDTCPWWTAYQGGGR